MLSSTPRRTPHPHHPAAVPFACQHYDPYFPALSLDTYPVRVCLSVPSCPIPTFDQPTNRPHTLMGSHPPKVETRPPSHIISLSLWTLPMMFEPPPALYSLLVCWTRRPLSLFFAPGSSLTCTPSTSSHTAFLGPDGSSCPPPLLPHSVTPMPTNTNGDSRLSAYASGL